MDNLSSEELTEWMAFYELEPWGSLINNKRHATTAATVANVGLMISNPKRLRADPFSPEQFEIKTYEPRVSIKQTWEEQKKMMESVTKKANPPFKRKAT